VLLVEGGGLGVALERVQAEAGGVEPLGQRHQRRADAAALVRGRDEDLAYVASAIAGRERQEAGQLAVDLGDEDAVFDRDLVGEAAPPLGFGSKWVRSGKAACQVLNQRSTTGSRSSGR
jgi:hypothetical protein